MHNATAFVWPLSRVKEIAKSKNIIDLYVANMTMTKTKKKENF